MSADLNSSMQIMPNTSVSSLSGNASLFEDKAVASPMGVKGGKRSRKAKKSKASRKPVKSAKRKTAKKCWWKFF